MDILFTRTKSLGYPLPATVVSMAAHGTVLSFRRERPFVIQSRRRDFLSSSIDVVVTCGGGANRRVGMIDVLLFAGIGILPFSRKVPTRIVSCLSPAVRGLGFRRGGRGPVVRLGFGKGRRVMLGGPVRLGGCLSSKAMGKVVAFALTRRILGSKNCLGISRMRGPFGGRVMDALVHFFVSKGVGGGNNVLVFSARCPRLLGRCSHGSDVFVAEGESKVATRGLSGVLGEGSVGGDSTCRDKFLRKAAPACRTCVRLGGDVTTSLG